MQMSYIAIGGKQIESGGNDEKNNWWIGSKNTCVCVSA